MNKPLTRKELEKSLKIHLEFLKSDIEVVINDLDQADFGYLFESFQTIFPICSLLGKLETIKEEEGREERGIHRLEPVEECDGHCSCNDCIQAEIDNQDRGE